MLREREEAVGREPLCVAQMPRVEDFELRSHAIPLQLREDGAHDREAIFKDVVAEIHRAAGQRRHLGTQRERCGSLRDRHADRPSGRELNDQAAARADRRKGRAKARGVARVPAIVGAAVHVNERGAGRLAAGGRFPECLRRERQMRRLRGRELRTHRGDRDDQRLHPTRVLARHRGLRASPSAASARSTSRASRPRARASSSASAARTASSSTRASR